MKKLFKHFLSVLITLVVPLFIGSVAHAAEITWSGGGANGDFSDTDNWVGGVAPVNGDSIVIPAGTPRVSLNNDSGVSLSGITLPSSPSAFEAITLQGALSISGDINIDYNRRLYMPNTTLTADIVVNLEMSMTGNTVNGTGDISFSNSTLDLGGNTITFQQKNYSPISATGLPLGYAIYIPEVSISGVASDQLIGDASTSIIIRGVELDFGSTNTENSTYLGSFVVNDGVLGSTNVESFGSADITLNNSQLHIGDSTSTVTKNITNNVTFNGNLFGATFGDNYAIGQGSIQLIGDFDLNFSGDVQFLKDTLMEVGSVADERTITFSGAVSGTGIPALDSYDGNYLLVINASSNTSPVPNGSYQAVDGPATLADTLASTDLIITGGDVTVNGERRNVILATGARLKGTGTVGNVLVQEDAYLSPGLSPGCIATGNLTLAGTFEAELNGSTACTEYDRTNVTGTVNLTGSTLLITRTGAVPAVNTTYTIINNDGSDAVTGTFVGLAQGGTTVVDGVTYTISYTGGDGNDVVLTVTGSTTPAPGTPNTGFSLLKSNIALPILAIISGLVLIGARRFAFKK